MLDKVKEKLKSVSDGNVNIVVAVSGGADSVALLHALCSLKEELGLSVSACHINHNLRGEESDGDEQYVRNLCEKLGVPLNVYSVDVRGSAKKHESTEETARKLRYECFEKEATEKNALIATAHTASDNAETVIMNILRGTGTKGLCGIPVKRGYIVRPLLGCTREDIEEYCKSNSLRFVTDSTNLSDDYTRNRIRHNVIPLLSEFNPSLITTFTRMTEAVTDDNAFIERFSQEKAEECKADDGKYDSRKLSALERPVLRRIISRILKDSDVEPSALRIAQCEEIIHKGLGKVNLCKNKFAMVRKKKFFILTEIQNYRTKST